MILSCLGIKGCKSSYSELKGSLFLVVKGSYEVVRLSRKGGRRTREQETCAANDCVGLFNTQSSKPVFVFDGFSFLLVVFGCFNYFLQCFLCSSSCCFVHAQSMGQFRRFVGPSLELSNSFDSLPPFSPHEGKENQ